ncbi:hypothetical protein BDZ45DRAFT_671460 [Acephala macrosclerotiorum]|nr:hypothetical protein BDZ45DRAFT_671460 [Acephala macrosclerotiorum]
MAGRKRKAVADASETPSTRRSSGRVSKARVSYQESHSDVGDAQSDDDFKEQESDVEKAASDDESDEPVEDPESDAPEDEDGSENEFEKKLKKQGWKKTKGKDGKTQMVMDIPQPKDAGNTPYEDERMHPNTMDFLRDLKKNNRREWLKFHDLVFRQAEKDFYTFVGKLSPIVSEKDATIPELPIKDVIYRIYRDVRFSSDPTPYKPYFSVSWSRTGRKGPYAHYYLHIQPNGESFFGGGYYASDNLTLACLREDIDQQPHQFKSILMGEKFRKTFFPSAGKDEKKVIAAFCKMSGDNALKTKPKGYSADHKDVNLLKLRHFVVSRKIPDAEILSENVLEIIADIVEAIEPFITYLNNVVMPDR